MERSHAQGTCGETRALLLLVDSFSSSAAHALAAPAHLSLCGVCVVGAVRPAPSQPLRIVQMAANGDMARSCAFSPNGEHLAVGMTSGGVKVMEFHPALAQVSAALCSSWLSCFVRVSLVWPLLASDGSS